MTSDTIYAHRACGILYRALKALEPTKPFLIPANVCPVVPCTFLSASVPFEVVDINSKTLCIDEQLCIEKIKTGLYSGLVYVRTYGTIYDTTDFMKEVKDIDKNFIIIDDRCLCAPKTSAEKTHADIVLFSTGYAKYVNLGKYAFAHVTSAKLHYMMTKVPDLIYNNKVSIEDYYKSVIKKGDKVELIPEGWLDTHLLDEQHIEGYKQTVNAEICASRKQKELINNIYDKELSHVKVSDKHNDWRYSIRVRNKQEIIESIFAAGLFVSSHYMPINRLFLSSANTPNADKLYNSVINLFNDNYIDELQATKICKLINSLIR